MTTRTDMTPTNVIEAARLIEQYNKLGGFLKEVPQSANSMTITFREGRENKSITISDDKRLVDIRNIIVNLRAETLKEIIALGVDMALDYEYDE